MKTTVFTLINPIVCALAICAAKANADESATLADKICASYDRITSLSCQVRKTTEVRGHKPVMLSRVYYQRPDRLHVENISPLKRRILADGKNFYLTQSDWKKYYSVPLADLSGEWKIMQQSIPGTALEHLLRLKDIPEELLDSLPDMPTRRGYKLQNLFVVISCDDQNRLVRIEFFKTPKMHNRTAVYNYNQFVHAGDDCWLAARQEAELTIKGEILREIRRFDNLQVNQPIAAGLFDPNAFFSGLEQVSDFSDLNN